MPGRWLVDIWKKSAIYQPLTHYSTMRYTPAGRYGRFFALIKFCKHTRLETRHNYPKSVIRDFFRAKSQIIVGGVIIIVSVY